MLRVINRPPRRRPFGKIALCYRFFLCTLCWLFLFAIFWSSHDWFSVFVCFIFSKHHYWYHANWYLIFFSFSFIWCCCHSTVPLPRSRIIYLQIGYSSLTTIIGDVIFLILNRLSICNREGFSFQDLVQIESTFHFTSFTRHSAADSR